MDDLFARIASGDASARDPLINCLYATALKRVDYQVNKLPSIRYFTDELEGIVLLKLVQVIEAMTGKRVTKPRQYVQMALDNAIKDAIAEEQNQAYGASTVHDARANDRDISQPTFESLSEEIEGKSGGNANDLLEVILSCCQDDIDRQIVELRHLNHSDQEVADKINDRAGCQSISKSTVNDRRKKIEARLYKKLPEWRKKDE